MTNCKAYIDIEGKGRFYCTLTKGEHKQIGHHEARGFGGKPPAIKWNGEFQRDR